MTSADDNARASRSTRLLSSIRDVLFEKTEEPPQKSAEAMPVTSAAPAVDSEIEAARSVLRAAIEGQLGPGIREYSWQFQALIEALPEAASRRRAALRVLALKGTTHEHLRQELEHALSTLTAQGEAFARKLHERREALSVSRQDCAERCTHETAEADGAIELLNAQLAVQQRALVDARARRDQQLAAVDVTQKELLAREAAFQRAYHDVEHDYLSLKRELSEEPQ